MCLGQRLFALRPKPEVLDSGYLEASLKSGPVRSCLLARASGTTAQGIRQAELRRVSILLPPLPEQRDIASVLGALDEKIESNRRLASELAAVALALGPSRSAPAAISLEEIGEQIRVPEDFGQPYVGLDVMPKGSTILENWNREEGPAGASRRNYARATNALRESRTLTAFRNALLPKLVSGQIRVPLSDDPEEQIAAAAGSPASTETDGASPRPPVTRCA